MQADRHVYGPGAIKGSRILLVAEGDEIDEEHLDELKKAEEAGDELKKAPAKKAASKPASDG